MKQYCVAYNPVECSTIIEKLDYSKIWSNDNPTGWTYQQVFGSHMMAPMYETSNFKEAHKVACDLIRQEVQ